MNKKQDRKQLTNSDRTVWPVRRHTIGNQMAEVEFGEIHRTNLTPIQLTVVHITHMRDRQNFSDKIKRRRRRCSREY